MPTNTVPQALTRNRLLSTSARLPQANASFGSSSTVVSQTRGVDKFFKITERGSTVGREVRGGVVTFFTMAYIVVLNPLILGFANDGIAGVPGVLRVTVESQDGKVLKSGCLDAGYPLPGKIRQAQLVLPNTTDWKGLKLRAEIEVKGMRYPVRWACHQKLNDDGSLTLRPNLRQQV